MTQQRLDEEILRREAANNMAPFPVYDTEVIIDLKVLKQIMENNPDYDELKVDYCKTCLSLSLKDIIIPSEKSNSKEDAITYCISCGNTEISTAITIFEWKEIYSDKYNTDFLKE